VLTSEPNACFGLGAGGSDAAEEPTSGLTVRVPARRPVLIQVGARGAAAAAADEDALVSLSVDALADSGTPAGDRGDKTAPTARQNRSNIVDLSGASITEEDPAQPACPSLGTVWRKFRAGKAGKRHISVSGGSVNTLTVFRGKRPRGVNPVDCVNRETGGLLEMNVPVKRRQYLWIRLGTDRPLDGAEAQLRITDGTRKTVIDGGPGGADPTPWGPAGGFPGACFTSDVKRARVRGSALRGSPGAFNRLSRFRLALRISGAPICDAEVSLIGPRKRVYAQGRAVRLKGKPRVTLSRLRTFRRGAYRVRVTGMDLLGNRVNVRTSIRGTLR
jgi:hypothetical protein